MNKIEFGNKTRYFRKAKGLSQESLAELTDLSTFYISEMECGRAIPSLDSFIRLLNVLDVSPHLFFIANVFTNPSNLFEDITGLNLDTLTDTQIHKIRILFETYIEDITNDENRATNQKISRIKGDE